jgi:hypothetical protein
MTYHVSLIGHRERHHDSRGRRRFVQPVVDLRPESVAAQSAEPLLTVCAPSAGVLLIRGYSARRRALRPSGW